MKRLVLLVVAASLILAPSAFAAGKDLFEKKCTRCHGASKTVEKKGDKDYWKPLVERMQKKRTNFISDKEAVEITDFLVATYGTK